MHLPRRESNQWQRNGGAIDQFGVMLPRAHTFGRELFDILPINALLSRPHFDLWAVLFVVYLRFARYEETSVGAAM